MQQQQQQQQERREERGEREDFEVGVWEKGQKILQSSIIIFHPFFLLFFSSSN